jgi:hypothetical protein
MSEELAEHLLTELRDPEPKGFQFQDHVLRQDAGLEKLTESLRAEEPAALSAALGAALSRERDGWTLLKIVELCDRLAPPGLEGALMRFVEERAEGDDRQRFLAGRAAEVLLRLPLDLAARARAGELSQGPLRDLERFRRREQAARLLHRPRRVEWAILAAMMALGLLGTVLAFRALGP